MSAIEKDLSWHSKAANLNTDIKPLIAGKRISSISDEYIERENPATESNGIQIQVCSEEEVDLAVNTGRSAFSTWSTLPLMQSALPVGCDGSAASAVSRPFSTVAIAPQRETQSAQKLGTSWRSCD